MTSEIKKYSFKEGLSYEFERVNLAELYTKNFESLTVPHRADFYQIIWFKKGQPKHMIDFNHLDIKPNTILFVDKNSVQCFDPLVPIEGEVLLFTDNFFCKTEEDTQFLRSNMLFNDLHTISTIQVQDLKTIFHSFFQLIKKEEDTTLDYFHADILRNYLKNILLLSERARQNQNNITIDKGTDLECVIRFRDLLDVQFQYQKSVSKYALQLNVTQKRLSRATLKIMAITPKQMIDARILLEAKRLLVHNSASVKEIGYTLGFDEPTNFVKFFKKHQTITPKEFRIKF
ncbi:helix-turn-helix domain-containing protein [Polaribacter sp. Z014]|uniref:helix-turn-helix domain-containing protein n=1 Tax=unclassified Polaribacter TaxID=196858 RepID=UPI00193BDFE4|nr:helix-turn-helix domain-containing protein [Polaribacter sp. Q13]MCL7764633.1 helix-turn-helix domain-containing protein [Polaribacter sp. Z014]QVY66406.1 AraC family transcriptional regulator [Polaribacter sp. Q13]